MSADPHHEPVTRATRQRAAILSVLQHSAHYRSAGQLYAILYDRGESISRATVYRALQFFVATGSLKVLHTADGETRYRWCDRAGRHLHLICRQCGRAEEIAGQALDDTATDAAQRLGFSDVSPTAEVFGNCSACPTKTETNDLSAQGHRRPTPRSKHVLKS
ncbi:Fur family transcriptional regulator [Arthrobacter sp. B0490]|uniref:Fur family transcriptional regulator n=1 Tax=Arthrobacter sp. B0490 TaxID=2058891 RepID=UPI0015E2A4DE